MATKVPELVVVLLCIIGAGALVTAFAAFGKSMFGKDEPERDPYQRTPEQESYLQRVREMNRVAIWGFVKSQRREDRRLREREASDVEVQSGRSYSNVDSPTGYPQYNGSYRSQGYVHAQAPGPYLEEDYPRHGSANTGYDEQQRSYTPGREYPYMTQQTKHGAAETWSELPR